MSGNNSWNPRGRKKTLVPYSSNNFFGHLMTGEKLTRPPLNKQLLFLCRRRSEMGTVEVIHLQAKRRLRQTKRVRNLSRLSCVRRCRHIAEFAVAATKTSHASTADRWQWTVTFRTSFVIARSKQEEGNAGPGKRHIFFLNSFSRQTATTTCVMSRKIY